MSLTEHVHSKKGRKEQQGRQYTFLRFKNPIAYHGQFAICRFATCFSYNSAAYLVNRIECLSAAHRLLRCLSAGHRFSRCTQAVQHSSSQSAQHVGCWQRIFFVQVLYSWFVVMTAVHCCLQSANSLPHGQRCGTAVRCYRDCIESYSCRFRRVSNVVATVPYGRTARTAI